MYVALVNEAKNPGANKVHLKPPTITAVVATRNPHSSCAP